MDSGMPRRGMLHLILHGESDSDNEQVGMYGPIFGPESLHSAMDPGYRSRLLAQLLLGDNEEQPQEQQDAMFFGARLNQPVRFPRLQQETVGMSNGIVPYESSPPELYKVGVMRLDVVGVEQFPENVGEWGRVILIRSPIPGDSGILVLNHSHQQQVGYVDPSVAVALAPLMDSQVVSTSCVVPTPGYVQGMVKVSCYVHLFSSVDSLRMVRDALCRSSDNFLRNHFTAELINPMPGYICPSRVDGFFDRLKERLSCKPAAPPIEPPREVIRAELFPHQKEALGWLVERESSTDLPPFWFEKDGLYVNELTGLVNDENSRPDPFRGGIFADDSGSGKRLTLISLMALDKCITSPWICHDPTGDDNYDANEPWFKIPDHEMPCSSRRLRPDTGLGLGRRGSIRKRATLVICEAAALWTWESQIKRHTEEESMTVYMYHGRRTSSVEVIKQFDVVLTTYRTLAVESQGPDTTSPLCKLTWWRVILDGADTLKRVSDSEVGSRTIPIVNLRADRRWALTSCPISTDQMFTLLTFVRLHPFYLTRYWRIFIGDLLETGDPAGFSRLQVVFDSVAHITTKDILGPLVVEQCFVELSPREREIYEEAESDSKSIVQSFLTTRTLLINYTSVLSMILRLRQICTDALLRRYDINPLILPSEIQDVSKRPELLEKLIGMLHEGEELECPICICPLVDAVITICAHVFCRWCIMRTMNEFASFCPMCRSQLTEADLFAAKPDEEADRLSSLSSKVKQLIRLLDESKAESPNGKSVVFTQFPKMVPSLEQPLREAGYNVFVVEESMSRKKREDVIMCYDFIKGPSVLIVSLKMYGTGLELTEASTVYLLEPWWNPLAEKQAVERVHRLGNKNAIRVVRFIVKDTIEERVLQLQDTKRNATQWPLAGRAARFNRNLNADEFRLLMGL